MRAILYSNKFKKNMELMVKRGKDAESVKAVIAVLAGGGVLDRKYKDHALTVILQDSEIVMSNRIGF